MASVEQMRAVEQRVEALEQSVERGDKWVEGEFEVAEKGLGLLTEELEELKQSMAELKAELARLKAAPAKKAKKAAAEPAEALKPSKAPSAWNQLVAQTVAEMRESGWQSWTDLKGVVWPASKRALVKDKSGALSEAWVYDGGEHDGKPPSPALGGMVRASCLKAQSDPEVMAKALAYHAKLAEKRQSSSSSASVSGASAAEPPKKVRAKMTEEQKAAAAAKRAAKKAGAEAASATTSDAEQPKAAAEPKPKPKRVQSEGQKAWGALVADTVAQMKEHGWEAWTDAKSGAAWPASAASSAGHVFSEGPHQGKVPSNQRGGMSRASFLKAQAVGLQGEWAEMERE